MIRAVTFDLWSTLLCANYYGDCRIDFLAKILDREGFSIGRQFIETGYLSAINYFGDQWKRCKDRQYMSAVGVVEFILMNLDIKLSTESKCMVIKAFEEVILCDPPPLIKGARNVLKSLHDHYRIGLISNSGVTPGRILKKVLENHEILQYFQSIIFSDEVGYTKPHPAIFRKAVEELHVKKDEVVHVGDLLETDIAGAKAAGMRTIWFNMTGNTYEGKETGFMPDYKIVALSQLLEILKK